MLLIDTHVLIWLDEGNPRLGAEALRRIDRSLSLAAGTLEGFHGDPADRIIAATALIHDATLLTADKKIPAWPSIQTVDASC